MGCDIHIYREKLVDGKWITGDTWEEEGDDDGEIQYYSQSEVGGDRNYELFAALAQVRCGSEVPAASYQPKGLPKDMSKEVSQAERQWRGDGHSHSHLYLNQLKHLRFYSKGCFFEITGYKEKGSLAELKASIASGSPDWELLHPYAERQPNLDGLNEWAEFRVEVPSSFGYSDQLQEIIDGLEEIGGENQRVVFWFDN